MMHVRATYDPREGLTLVVERSGGPEPYEVVPSYSMLPQHCMDEVCEVVLSRAKTIVIYSSRAEMDGLVREIEAWLPEGEPLPAPVEVYSADHTILIDGEIWDPPGD